MPLPLGVGVAEKIPIFIGIGTSSKTIFLLVLFAIMHHPLFFCFQLTSCIEASWGFGGCKGGSPLDAFKMWQSSGLVTGGLNNQSNSCQPYPFEKCEKPMCLDMQKWMQNMQKVHNGQMTLPELNSAFASTPKCKFYSQLSLKSGPAFGDQAFPLNMR